MNKKGNFSEVMKAVNEGKLNDLHREEYAESCPYRIQEVAMAIADIIPEIYRAAWETRLRQVGVWRPLVRDESGEIAEAGDEVEIPSRTTTL